MEQGDRRVPIMPGLRVGLQAEAGKLVWTILNRGNEEDGLYYGWDQDGGGKLTGPKWSDLEIQGSLWGLRLLRFERNLLGAQCGNPAIVKISQISGLELML